LRRAFSPTIAADADRIDHGLRDLRVATPAFALIPAEDLIGQWIWPPGNSLQQVGERQVDDLHAYKRAEEVASKSAHGDSHIEGQPFDDVEAGVRGRRRAVRALFVRLTAILHRFANVGGTQTEFATERDFI